MDSRQGSWYLCEDDLRVVESCHLPHPITNHATNGLFRYGHLWKCQDAAHGMSVSESKQNLPKGFLQVRELAQWVLTKSGELSPQEFIHSKMWPLVSVIPELLLLMEGMRQSLKLIGKLT